MYGKNGYMLSVADCQQYAQDMVGLMVANTDGAKPKKMSALADRFVKMSGPNDGVDRLVDSTRECVDQRRTLSLRMSGLVVIRQRWK